eukprot:g1018.t1
MQTLSTDSTSVFQRFNVPPDAHIKPENIHELSQSEFDRRLDNILEESKLVDGEGPPLSVEEANRMKEAFKKKEFKDLFQDYLDEISDPKNRAEYDAYLKQCEDSGKVPENVHLIQPEAGFVLKTKDERGGKVFINVCSAKEIDQPHSEKIKDEKTGKIGQRWHLPHSIGPQHVELDKKKNKCPTFDVAFHPDTLLKCSENTAFRDMVAKSALDGVIRRQHQQGDKSLSFQNWHRILKGVTCLGGKPLKMNIGGSSSSSLEKEKPKKVKHSSSRPKNMDSKLEERMKKGFSLKKKKDTIHTSLLPVEKKREGAVVPKFRIIHRGELDLSDYLADSIATEYQRKHGIVPKRPKELVVKVTLPQCKSTKKVVLDVSEKTLKLERKGKYYLNISLPFEVDCEAGSARFIKETKELVVVMPVLPPPLLPADEKDENLVLEEIEGKMEVVCDTNGEKKLGVSLERGVRKGKVSSTLLRKEKYNPYLRQDCPFEEEERRKFSKEIQERANAALKKHEKKKHMERKAKEGKQVVVIDEYKFEDFGSFLAAPRYDKHRPGYYFRLGDFGMGYYRDDHENACERRGGNHRSSPETESEVTSTSKKNEKIPNYRAKQFNKTWTLLVDVVNVDESSVDAKFSKDGFELHFSTNNEKKEFYHLSLLTASTIDPTKCRFKVTDKNMAVILMKVEEGLMWKSLCSELIEEENGELIEEENGELIEEENGELIEEENGELIEEENGELIEEENGELIEEEKGKEDDEESAEKVAKKFEKSSRKENSNFTSVSFQNKVMWELD